MDIYLHTAAKDRFWGLAFIHVKARINRVDVHEDNIVLLNRTHFDYFMQADKHGMTDFHPCSEMKAIARVTNHKYHQMSHAPTLPLGFFFSRHESTEV